MTEKMKRFSERIGVAKPPEIQLDCVNEALRNSLWNIILGYLDYLRENDRQYETECIRAMRRASVHYRRGFIKNVAGSFFKVAVDDLSSNADAAQQWLKIKFGGLEWYRVYEFVEFLVQNYSYFKERIQAINKVLEEENSAHRLMNGRFKPFTNEQEIREIEEAVKKASKAGLEGAREHLSTALSKLAEKPIPDYRNSIKESISAIESVVKQISGESGGGLDKALTKLSGKIDIHEALKQGFIKLYGYTSDENGIRHPILEKPNVGLDEARFMLVSCSAFTNYLISKAQKAGLLKEG